MYCSSCASAVTPGLSYCNRCGASLSAKAVGAGMPSDVPPEYLIWAILAVSVGGLGVMIGLMAVMKQALHFNTGLIVGFSLLSFLLLVAAESVFIWMLVRPRSFAKEVKVKDTLRLWEEATKVGAVADARVLAEAAPTVTEHTTRTLEPASGQRDAEVK